MYSCLTLFYYNIYVKVYGETKFKRLKKKFTKEKICISDTIQKLQYKFNVR
jgi:hypothetical protein